MKQLHRKPIHKKERSHDCLIVEFTTKNKERKIVKFTYETYNSAERCTTEVFDGYKLSIVLSLIDLGIEPNTSAYLLLSDVERLERANMLFAKSKEIITKML